MSKKEAVKVPTKRTGAKRTGAKRAAVKKSAPKAAEEKAGGEEAAKPMQRAPAPTPMIFARHELDMHERRARGYSLGELESAGLAFSVAKKAEVPIDTRRRSALEVNVARLKGWYLPRPKKEVAGAEVQPKAEGRTRKTGQKSKKAVTKKA